MEYAYEEEDAEEALSAESSQYENLEISVLGSISEQIDQLSVSSNNLVSIKSDATGPALEDEAHPLRCAPKKGSAPLTTDDYMNIRNTENQEFLNSSLHAVESLAPFTLKRVYGRLDKVPVLNLTGLYKNHIVYASSSVIIIYDFVENTQQCLQGHRNAIASLEIERKGRFMVSSAAGKRNLMIIWETLTGKPLKYFTNAHDGQGSLFACFTGVDFIFSSIGAEELGKQTICFWNFEPKEAAKTPILIAKFPKTKSLLKELSFSSFRPQFFAATGERNVIFGTWVRDTKGDSVVMHKPKLRKTFIGKYKSFTCSLWMKKGEWLATATGAGFVVIWGPPVVLALEEPTDSGKNIRDFLRSYKLCEERINVFKIYKEYVVVGDEGGVVRFFDHEFKLLRWSKNFNLPAIQSIFFNTNEEIPEFKANLRQKYNSGDEQFPAKEQPSRIKEYTRGGAHFRQASKTTIPKPPMPCPDFVVAVAGGDIYYYHFNEGQIDLICPGTPGAFVSCDACPGSNHIAFTTAKGDVQVYDFTTHDLIFSDKIFAGNAKVTTMKFHPFGQICSFGLSDGRISFRWNYTWKTAMPPTILTPNSVVKIIYSIDGLHLAYYDVDQNIAVMKYLPKGHGWMVLGKSKAHSLPIMDLQFFIDPGETCNRLFSISLDRHLIEYDIDKSAEDFGLYIVKITSLEQTARPSAMVFDGPPEYGIDCITFVNNINKIRMFSLEEEAVKKTCAGPIFGRKKGIQRMIPFPTQQRKKTFIVYIVKNKLGFMDTPIDGNPHKYMAVHTHPKEIVEIAILPDREKIFTIGKDDNSGFVWDASPKAVEATVLMGGSGVTPFYHTLKRHWGGACQDIIKDLDMIFFFLNIKRIEKQTELYRMNRNIRLCELSAVCRACGFFPSEYEVDLMMDEARRLKQEEQSYTDDFSTELSFDDFLKIFVNHFYRTTDEDVEEAFTALGFAEPDKDPYMCKHDFVNYLTNEGEKINPRNFPIFYDAMYDVRQPGEFGVVKCHTFIPENAIGDSSASSDTPGKLEEDADLDSISSTSSSNSDDDDEPEAEEAEEEEMEEEEEEEEQNDDGDEKRKSEERRESFPVEIPEEEEEDGEDEGVETEDLELPEDLTEEKEVKEPVEEQMVDLPERIDLTYFLNTMIPPESQQTMRWMTKENAEKGPEAPVVEKDGKEDNKEFFKSLLKQIVDPTQPIPKKLLNTLYAEYYLEHGDFSVPPDIRFPDIGLPGVDTSNLVEAGEEEEEEDEDDKTHSENESIDDLDEEDEEDENEDEEKESKKTRKKGEAKKASKDENTSKEEEEEEEEETSKNLEEEETSNNWKEEDEEEGNEDTVETLEEEEDNDEDSGGLRSQPSFSIMALESSYIQYDDDVSQEDDKENGILPSTAENNDTTMATDNEEATFSDPFTLTENQTVTDPQNREYETDATEEMTDVENAFDQEDLQFVKNVNSTFKPSDQDDTEPKT